MAKCKDAWPKETFAYLRWVMWFVWLCVTITEMKGVNPIRSREQIKKSVRWLMQANSSDAFFTFIYFPLIGYSCQSPHAPTALSSDHTSSLPPLLLLLNLHFSTLSSNYTVCCCVSACACLYVCVRAWVCVCTCVLAWVHRHIKFVCMSISVCVCVCMSAQAC